MLSTKRKSSNLRPLSSRWSLHTSDHVIPCPRVAHSSRFIASDCADTRDSVPLDRGGRPSAFQSRRRSLRHWPLSQLRWECYEISRRDVGSGWRWGRSAAVLQCGDDGSHSSVAVQVEEIASSVVGSAWGVVVEEMALVRAFVILFFDGFKLFLSLAIMVHLLWIAIPLSVSGRAVVAAVQRDVWGFVGGGSAWGVVGGKKTRKRIMMKVRSPVL